MDDQLYDEFGNYIGPDLEDEDEDLGYDEEEEQQEEEVRGFETTPVQGSGDEQEREEIVEESALMQIDGGVFCFSLDNLFISIIQYANPL